MSTPKKYGEPRVVLGSRAVKKIVRETGLLGRGAAGATAEDRKALENLVRHVAVEVNPFLPEGQRIELPGKTFNEISVELDKLGKVAKSTEDAAAKATAAIQGVDDRISRMSAARRGAYDVANRLGQPSAHGDPSGFGVLEEGDESRAAFRSARMDIEFDPLGHPVPSGTVKGPAKIVNIGDQLRESSFMEGQDARFREAMRLEKGVAAPLTRSGVPGPAVTRVTPHVRSLLESGLTPGQVETRMTDAIQQAVGGGDAEKARTLGEVLKEYKIRLSGEGTLTSRIGAEASAMEAGAEYAVPKFMRAGPGAAAAGGEYAGLTGGFTAEQAAAASTKVVGKVAKGLGTVGKLAGGAAGAAAFLLAEGLMDKEQGEYHSEDFLSRAFGSGGDREAAQRAFGQQHREHEARMTLERLQGDMAANTVRLATMRPELYNQLLYKRMLPRGVTPIGGNPDDGFLNQVTLAMSMGKFDRGMSAEEEFAASRR